MARVDRRFAQLLRSCRQRQGMTQQMLASQVGLSQRYVSFLESGRSRPSEALVVRLLDSLAVPRGERNAWLLAAGWSPGYDGTGHTPANQQVLDAALATVLKMHAPYPALVMDRCWNIRRANRAAQGFYRMFLPRELTSVNAMEACLEPAARPYLENWDDLARMMIARVRRELAHRSGDELRALLARLERLPGVGAISAAEPEHDHAVSSLPIFPLEVRVGTRRASLFSVVAAVGTVDDAWIDDTRIELYYPADEETRGWLEELDRRSP